MRMNKKKERKNSLLVIKKFSCGVLFDWCAEGDLNPHRETPTRPSTLRVYHSATCACKWCVKGDLNPHRETPDKALNLARLPFRHPRLHLSYRKYNIIFDGPCKGVFMKQFNLSSLYLFYNTFYQI